MSAPYRPYPTPRLSLGPPETATLRSLILSQLPAAILGGAGAALVSVARLLTREDRPDE